MIRLATVQDKHRVMAMAKVFHESAGHPFPYNAVHCSSVISACIAGGDALCLVLERDGKIVGALLAHAGPHTFNPVRIASEIMLWIEPGHRGGRHAAAMIDAFETWAKGRGCALAHMVGLGGNPAIGKFYERRGYYAAECHYVKRLAA
ncbi:GNAT family N-acetyltransferase [Limoniibacter endophyticus]|uniref:N-acetyltransferase domain-containing protein n=1 Tax=Limoniibacter endophyticus TaxID=1565040 RepID=A0A8J3DKR5_9HYPH|nr:GNAT family N-acetyltransferase [Limoniibacter endophyticus]GHC61666.1 hypothetical protein GCM10010136_02350 [Limoniibacter endophyticus]